MEKFDARKLSPSAQQEIRYQVIRLREKGHIPLVETTEAGWKRFEILQASKKLLMRLKGRIVNCRVNT